MTKKHLETKRLIMLGDLTKPIDTLINKTSDGLIGFLKPWQMKRIAKAEIEIERMKAVADIEGDSFASQCQRNMVSRKVLELSNLHNITIEARKHLGETDIAQNLTTAFKEHFVDSSKLEDDEFLQSFWGRLLAGEIKDSGSFDKRTMQFVKNLSYKEAHNLSHLMRYSIKLCGCVELVLPISRFNGLSEAGLSNEVVNHFEHLGVFSRAEPRRTFIPPTKDENDQKKHKVLLSTDSKIVVYASLSSGNPKKLENGDHFILTKTPLTRLGKQLSSLTDFEITRKTRKSVFSEVNDLNRFKFAMSFDRAD